jgi:hypothetical protein
VKYAEVKKSHLDFVEPCVIAYQAEGRSGEFLYAKDDLQ